MGIYLDKITLKIIALVLLFGIIQILISICGTKLHLVLPSKIRSTSEFVVSTSTRFLVMIFMPLIAYVVANGSWLYLIAFFAILLAFANLLSAKRVN